ncbi:MAG: cobalamin biosynthesis protein CbiM [Deltaproteobacteria bacterium]|nr:MAG: cobalamin biosynthesis protein CbiM [Deltaproteobacteria bacterium]
MATDVGAAAALAAAVRKAEERLSGRQVPLMGVMAAFVFAAQMVNFPIPGGTSGHLLGAVLLSVMLGPPVAAVVMFCVLLVQALLFQDGGITALGANFINMALVGVLAGGAVAKVNGLLRTDWMRSAAVFLSCWLSVVAGAVLYALELWLSGKAPLGPVVVTMASVHALIGLGEGALTIAAMAVLRSARLWQAEARG